jgi:predicted mannosyl-3-phosphoglycerate phosphatase (HAD superfamily)
MTVKKTFFLDQNQIDLIQEALGSFMESLDSQTDQLLENGKAIKKDNSYSNSDTGYNLVSDVEYTPEYELLTDKIDQAQKLSQQFNI